MGQQQSTENTIQENVLSQRILNALTSLHIDELSAPLENGKSVSISVKEVAQNTQENKRATTHSPSNTLNLAKNLHIQVKFNYANKSQHTSLCKRISACLSELDLPPFSLRIESHIKRHQIQSGAKGIANIKNIIAIGSGKGGVGKSTVAVNLARAWSQEGARVGLLDADIYGPSIPTMLGIHERPTSPDGKTMTPLKSGDLQAMSIGFLTEQDTPMIWRGPIVTNTLKQLLSETNWGDLDYLIIDLPPGTGDTQLTLAQNIPVSGAIIVTTPQNVALADARKAIRMFEKVNIHTLGIIENMSYFTCPYCQQTSHIFQKDGGNTLSENYMVNLLGNIPLNEQICHSMDKGTWLQNIRDENQHPYLFEYYQKIARKASALLSKQPIDFTAKMPSVEIKSLN